MAENNFSFTRGALRSLMTLSKEDQTRVHLWIEQLGTALEQGHMPINNSDVGNGATENKIAIKLTPYDGQLVGVDLDENVHIACAFTEKNCVILSLNMTDNIDF